jgi:hypothetical protein
MNKANSSMLLFFHKRFRAFAHSGRLAHSGRPHSGRLHSGRLNVPIVRFCFVARKGPRVQYADLNA